MGKNMETAKERVLSAYPRLPKGGKIERKQEVLLKLPLRLSFYEEYEV